MFDYPAESQCGSENIIYRLFRKFTKGATKEEALDEILREDSQNDTESTQNNTDE
jgi:hypothetical protein